MCLEAIRKRLKDTILIDKNSKRVITDASDLVAIVPHIDGV